MFSIFPPVQCSIALKEDPRKKILFESFPDTISESYSANVQKVPNSLKPVTTLTKYGGGDYGNFALSLRFVAGLNTPFSGGNDVLNTKGVVSSEALKVLLDKSLKDELSLLEKKVRFLLALCFPKPPEDLRISAQEKLKENFVGGTTPVVLISIGSFLTIEGQATSWDVQWSAPWHPETAQPYVADVTMSFIRLYNFFPDYYDIINQVDKIDPITFMNQVELEGRIRLGGQAPQITPKVVEIVDGAIVLRGE